ncbi:M20 family metallopeptidase [Marinicrinis sediminis]|uniref:M20 family metallopeptidase n=1 Tax=Marinicrinis sediminis TaxID=1652465 RepID=A0ABW5R6Z3_9BACL
MTVTNWTDYFEHMLPEMTAELKHYAEFETPTSDKQSVDALGDYIAAQFEQLGCRVRKMEQPIYGNQLIIEYGTAEDSILCLGHFDTVKPVGTIEQQPLLEKDGKLYGPGVYDMKNGIVIAYFVLKTIIEQQLPLLHKLVFFWNTDEEVGSPSSREAIQDIAAQCQAVLVLEPSTEDGEINTSRKGGGEFYLKVLGRESHAGNEHQQGVNAIEELSRHIPTIQSWTDYEAGTTCSVGLITGGTASNVVPGTAEAVIDVRVSTQAERERITRLFQQLKPIHPEAKLELSGSIYTPPMERTERSAALFRWIQQLAAEEQLHLQERGSGGMSDGNYAAGSGTPVVDGLGAAGAGAHAVHEHILIHSLAERASLLLRLLASNLPGEPRS